MKLKIIFILLITISLASKSLSLMEISADPNRYSRILLDKHNEQINCLFLGNGENPFIGSVPMHHNEWGNIYHLPDGYINLLWRNPVTGDFIVGDNSLQPDGHRSATIFNTTSLELGKVVNSSSLNTAYKNYFSVANAGSFAYDTVNNLIYMCSVYERGVFPLTSTLLDKATVGIRETGTCEQIRIMNNVFYFLDFALNGTKSNIYSNTSGELFSHYASSPILVSDTTIKDFDVSSTHLYYANSFTNKLFEIPITGQINSYSKREILNFMPDSFGYHNGYIYYSFKNSLKKISIDPNSNLQPELIFDFNTTG
ncbi:hypothetical protein ACTFIY_012193 [Dictyostelium cf. discoideum]